MSFWRQTKSRTLNYFIFSMKFGNFVYLAAWISEFWKILKLCNLWYSLDPCEKYRYAKMWGILQNTQVEIFPLDTSNLNLKNSPNRPQPTKTSPQSISSLLIRDFLFLFSPQETLQFFACFSYSFMNILQHSIVSFLFIAHENVIKFYFSFCFFLREKSLSMRNRTN